MVWLVAIIRAAVLVVGCEVAGGTAVRAACEVLSRRICATNVHVARRLYALQHLVSLLHVLS